MAANYALQLLVANLLKPDRRYVDTALDNLHYLLGRNTFSVSWVTQVGGNPYQHPHHRPSAGMAEPWPGLLSGGPTAPARMPHYISCLTGRPPKCLPTIKPPTQATKSPSTGTRRWYLY